MPPIDTVVSEWSLVRFPDADDIVILWGIVQDDPSGRWRRGHYVCTSPVEEVSADGLIRTQNSVYKTLGPGQRVDLNCRQWYYLRLGWSPQELLDMASPH